MLQVIPETTFENVWAIEKYNDRTKWLLDYNGFGLQFSMLYTAHCPARLSARKFRKVSAIWRNRYVELPDRAELPISD